MDEASILVESMQVERLTLHHRRALNLRAPMSPQISTTPQSLAGQLYYRTRYET